MNHPKNLLVAMALGAATLLTSSALAQMGRRFPSEKKIVMDPVTGIPLTFLTSTPAGDSKIYQTHRQWTADGKWLIFRSNRVRGQAFAVNEETGAIVQVTENGYMGMLCAARLSMKLYIMRNLGGFGREEAARSPTAAPSPASAAEPAAPAGTPPAAAPAAGRGRGGPRGPFQIVEIDLARLFADSEAGTMKPAADYERICGTTPPGMMADGNMGLDANEDFMYFRVSGDPGQPAAARGHQDRRAVRPAAHGRRPDRPGQHESQDRRGESSSWPCRSRSATCRPTRGSPARSSSAGKPAARRRSAPGRSWPTAPACARSIPRRPTNGSRTRP